MKDKKFLGECKRFYNEDLLALCSIVSKYRRKGLFSITRVDSQTMPHYPKGVDVVNAWCFSGIK